MQIVIGPVLRREADHGSPRPGQAFGDPGDPAGAHPKRRGLPRRRALVAVVPAALGLLALILTLGAVQTVGAAILPGCLGFRAAVLKVRIHLPPAKSRANSGTGVSRDERMVLIPPPRRAGEVEEHREITWERIAAE